MPMPAFNLLNPFELTAIQVLTYETYGTYQTYETFQTCQTFQTYPTYHQTLNDFINKHAFSVY
jgi:hypothetical protein